MPEKGLLDDVEDAVDEAEFVEPFEENDVADDESCDDDDGVLDTDEVEPDAAELADPVDGLDKDDDEGVAVAVVAVCVRDAGEVEPPNVQAVPSGI